MIGRRGLLAAGALLAGAAPVPSVAPPPAAQPISRLGLPWWRQRHLDKLAEARSRPVDLVWLGDSITQDWERPGYQPSWQRWYGRRGGLNLGFSGDGTCHLLWRVENGEVEGIAPRAAVVLIGANNLGWLHWPAAENVAGIEAVVAAVRRRLPRSRILLLGILPSGRGAWVDEATAAINAALARRYRGSDEASFLDLGELFAPGGRLDTSLYRDPPQGVPLHPTAAAHDRMAAAIEPTLAKLLEVS